MVDPCRVVGAACPHTEERWKNTWRLAITTTKASTLPAIGLGWVRERLGLAGKARAEDFLRLCENQHPVTGETLTQRLNTTRTESGQSAANRRD